MGIKRKLLTSFLAKPAKDAEAWFQKMKVKGETNSISGNKTVYCISPYKTGTTYLSSSFDPKVSDHEPLQYLSMVELEKKFDGFFTKRMNSLNLKLECSGFFSAYIDELIANPIAKNLDYICILRSPSSWITSVINYWQRPFLQEQRYEYLTELFWKPKVGVDVRKLVDSDNKLTDIKAIDKLVEFYFDFTQKTKNIQNIHYVELNELDVFLPKVGKMINETPLTQRGWQRKAKEKKFEFKDNIIDEEYNKLIMHIT